MSHFAVNPSFARELEAEIRAKETLRPAAHTVAERAEAFTHHAMPRTQGGRVQVGEVNGDIAVINTNFGAHLEEWGLARTPPYAPLRRGVRAAGLKLRES